MNRAEGKLQLVFCCRMILSLGTVVTERVELSFKPSQKLTSSGPGSPAGHSFAIFCASLPYKVA